MALSIVCPGCDADYSVPENLLGKAIRCKKCGETIDVKARPKARVSRDDDADRPRKSAPRRRDDDEDDYESTPNKKGVSPVLIGGLAALLLGAGAAGAYFLFSESKPEEPQPIAKRDPDKKFVPEGTPVEEPKDEKKELKTEPKVEEKTAPKKVEDKKVEDKKPVEEKKPAEPKKATPSATPLTQPVPAPADSQAPGSSLGLSYDAYLRGDMPNLIQDQVKRSTVMMKVTSAGGSGSGSGWFGLAPNIVVTNAHVVDMLGRDAKPPLKIEIVMNTGTNEERIIPHSSIKILAVDGRIDLAILEVSGQKDLPPPLKVRNAEELKESQRLRIFGFPLGNSANQESGGTSKNASIAVRPTTVTAFRRNEFGQLFTIMTEGGMTNGNSGGPIVDAEGCVVAVVVRGYINRGFRMREQLLGSGIPSEWVSGLISGRLKDYTYGEPYKAGDKVKIPVTIRMLDPLKRVSEVGFRHWIGANNNKYRPPGTVAALKNDGDTDHKEVVFKYDAATQTAKGEIECDPLTVDKAVYWGQIFYTTASRPKFFEPGSKMNVEMIPAERVPAMLAAKPVTGQVRTLTVTSNVNHEVAVENDPDAPPDESLESTVTMKETVLKADPNDSNSIARLKLDYESVLLKGIDSGSSEEVGGSIARDFNAVFKKIQGAAWMNKSGAIYKAKPNYINLAQSGLNNLSPRLIQKALEISDGTLEALIATSIVLPNEEKKPGDTWTEEVPTILTYGYELTQGWAAIEVFVIDARTGARRGCTAA